MEQNQQESQELYKNLNEEHFQILRKLSTNYGIEYLYTKNMKEDTDENCKIDRVLFKNRETSFMS